MNPRHHRLIVAVDELIAFVDSYREHGSVIPLADIRTRFTDLDRTVTGLAFAVGLDSLLPKQDALARHLDPPERMTPTQAEQWAGMGRVRFEGGTNLPGDWENGEYLAVREEWRESLLTLRAAAAEVAGAEASPAPAAVPSAVVPVSAPPSEVAPADSVSDRDVPVWLGGQRVRVGKEEIVLTDREANVLEALVRSQPVTIRLLVSKSGQPDAKSILKQIVRRHPLLAPHIRFPGGKNGGGYRTDIRLLSAP